MFFIVLSFFIFIPGTYFFIASIVVEKHNAYFYEYHKVCDAVVVGYKAKKSSTSDETYCDLIIQIPDVSQEPDAAFLCSAEDIKATDYPLGDIVPVAYSIKNNNFKTLDARLYTGEIDKESDRMFVSRLRSVAFVRFVFAIVIASIGMIQILL